MTTSALYSAEQKTDIVLVEHTCTERALTIFGIVRPGRLRWVGPWLPRLPLDWQDLWRQMRPRKIRWGWVLLLAIAIVLVIGEFGPAASAIAPLP
jgi:hypothetical protein